MEWEKLSLAVYESLREIMDNPNADYSFAGYVSDEVLAIASNAVVNTLRASKAGQDELRENEIGE